MMKVKVLGALALLAFSAGAHPAGAQALPDTVLHAGSRIRVQSPDFGSKARVGNFVSLTSDTLSFTLEGETVPTRIPVAQVTALDISVGQTTNTRAVKKRNHLAEIIGTAAGAAVGIAAGSGSNTMKVLLGAAGAIGGYFAGHEYGVITSPNHDEWKPVMLPARGS